MPAICMFYNEKKTKFDLCLRQKAKVKLLLLFSNRQRHFFIRNAYRLLHKYHRGYISK